MTVMIWEKRITLLFHLVAFLPNIYALIFDGFMIESKRLRHVIGHDTLLQKIAEYVGSKLIFLTTWSMIIQTLYFGLSLVNDFFGSNVRPSQDPRFKRSRLQRCRDIFLSSIAFPVGMFVVCTFWGIYAVDRELVYPKHLDKIIPVWMNHVMHTTVLPFLLVEIYLIYHHFPSKQTGLKILLGFSAVYLGWILFIAWFADIWVYPILKMMQAHERIIFIIFLMCLFISIYILGESLNKFFWGRERSLALSKMKKK